MIGHDADPAPGEPTPTDVHWFEHDGRWWVVTDDAERECLDRTTAFQAARALARETIPSRMVSERPDSWGGAASLGDHEVGVTLGALPTGEAGWSRLAGPASLGRSVLVAEGVEAPAPWSDCARVAVRAADLSNPGFLAEVRRTFLTRSRAVYALATDVEEPPPGLLADDVYDVRVDHDFVPEATWALLTANAVDARSDPPVWPCAALAIRLGATPGGSADVLLPDGRAAWCDGGPLRLWTDRAFDGVAVVPREALLTGMLAPLVAREPDADLAADQLAAVSEQDVRARIIAPAGSGKTRVLTERARHLLRSSVPGATLTLVAFNKRAQLEMVDRTSDLPGLRIRTLNALALGILNGADGAVSERSRVITIDEVQVRELLSSLVRFPRRANTDPAAAWIEALSRIRLGLQTPRAVEAEYGGDVEGLVEVFPRYREELRRRGQVDFDEQIYRCIEVLLTEPAVRLAAQRRCQLVLVDEFQDLTPAHMLLLRLLASPALSIFGVGDDDQTIYGYSGASTRWLVHFDDFVPSPTHHALDVNYRCPVPVVAAVTNLLSRNRQRVEKSIRPGPANEASPDAIRVVTAEHPEAATAAAVLTHLGDGALPREIAVLARVNSVLVPVQAALIESGVPVRVRDGGGFLHRTGVAAALAWLRLAVSPDRFARGDVTLAARRPSRGIGPRVVEWIGEQSDVEGVERLAGRITDARTSDKVASFAKDLRRIGELGRTASSAVILEYAGTETGLARAVASLDEAHIGRNRQAHSDDLRALTALGRLHPDPRTFSSWLSRTLAAPDDADGVTLATVHTVKGLEWPHVIVHDATSGVFPHRLSTDIEEERRVFHVAITRAQRRLHIVADADSPSIFIDELSSRAEVAEATGDVDVGSRASPAIEATTGLVVQWGGYACTIDTVEQHHVEVSVGGARLTIPFGSEVQVEGRLRRLAPPTAGTSRAASSPVAGDPRVFEALKNWRRERSQRDKVPAYVVASDKTLEGIAAAMPNDEVSLLDVHGIGATKVELYGDEILAVVDQVRGAS